MSAPSKKDKKLSKEKSKDKSRKEAAPQTEASRRLAEFKVARNKKYEREDGTTPTMGAGQDLLSTLQIWPEDDLEFSLGDFEMTSVLGLLVWRFFPFPIFVECWGYSVLYDLIL